MELYPLSEIDYYLLEGANRFSRSNAIEFYFRGADPAGRVPENCLEDLLNAMRRQADFRDVGATETFLSAMKLDEAHPLLVVAAMAQDFQRQFGWRAVGFGPARGRRGGVGAWVDAISPYVAQECIEGSVRLLGAAMLEAEPRDRLADLADEVIEKIE